MFWWRRRIHRALESAGEAFGGDDGRARVIDLEGGVVDAIALLECALQLELGVLMPRLRGARQGLLSPKLSTRRLAGKQPEANKGDQSDAGGPSQQCQIAGHDRHDHHGDR